MLCPTETSHLPFPCRDVTMAHRIAGALEGSSSAASSLVVHVCGKAHCEGRLGIVEHLKAFALDVRVGIVVFLPARGVQLAEGGWVSEGLEGLADYVCLTEGSLPRSFGVQHPV
jgi:hypothetical protein